jgi:hypothetical protein
LNTPISSINAALRGVGLAPNQQIFPIGVERPSGSQQLGEMAPLDEELMDRSVFAEGDGVADERRKKDGEGLLGHLARSHFEFAVTRLPPPHRVALDAHIVRSVSDQLWASSPRSKTWYEGLHKASPQTNGAGRVPKHRPVG